MFGFKRSSKPKRKSGKSPTRLSINNNQSAEPKMLYNIPSVSQIAPLPQNKSHGILPVLSLDGRDAPNLMPLEPSDPDLANDHETTSNNNESNRQPVGDRYQIEMNRLASLPSLSFATLGSFSIKSLFSLLFMRV